MSAAPAVGRLEVARARAITRKLAGAVDLALELVVEAYEGRAWEVLGHESWAAYVAAEVPALSVIGRGLPLEERRDAVAQLRGRGLSLRGVGEVLGLAPNTVRRDAAEAGVQLVEVRSIDGSRRSAVGSSSRRRRRTPLTDRVVQLVAGAGDNGLSVLEVVAQLRTPRTEVAPALTRLVQAGRLSYVRPERRGQFGRYVREGRA